MGKTLSRKYIIVRYETISYGGLGEATEEMVLRKNGKFTKKFGFAVKFKSLEDAEEAEQNLIKWSNVRYEIRRLK